MRFLFSCFIALVAVGVLAAGAQAAKGGKGGNGFPPGTHFNLNVIAKWAERDNGNFTCPPAEDYQWKWVFDGTNDTCDPATDGNTCVQVPTGRNVIFIPREGSADQRIDVVSGGKGKKATSIEDKNLLEVTDWCTEAFGGTRGAFYLPDNSAGYEVFARLVGKPRHKKDDPLVSMTLVPDVESVSTQCEVLVDDGFGNLVPSGTFEACELLHVGTLDGTNVTVYRSGDGSSTGTVRGKGANKAVEVTDLFQFTGHVCLRPEPNFYENIGDFGVSTDEFCADGNCIEDLPLCCTDDSNLDGLFEACGYRDGGGDQANTPGYDPTTEPATDPTAGNVLTWGTGAVCSANVPDGTFTGMLLTEYLTDCQGPFVSEWVFNIADIVDYFLSLNNNGGYVLQMRFYPN